MNSGFVSRVRVTYCDPKDAIGPPAYVPFDPSTAIGDKGQVGLVAKDLEAVFWVKCWVRDFVGRHHFKDSAKGVSKVEANQSPPVGGGG